MYVFVLSTKRLDEFVQIAINKIEISTLRVNLAIILIELAKNGNAVIHNAIDLIAIISSVRIFNVGTR
jgi:hypothetical protein